MTSQTRLHTCLARAIATASLKGDFAVPGLFLGLKVGPTTSAATFTGGKCFHDGTGSPIAWTTKFVYTDRVDINRVNERYRSYSSSV